MIKQLTQLDTAFQLVKWWSLGIVGFCLLAMLSSGFYALHAVNQAKREIYLLAENQVLKASANPRESLLEVEARAHIKQVHQLLFMFSPDEQLINDQLNEAFYLGDASIKFHVDNLKESGYYKQVLAASVSQRVLLDSIAVDITQGDFPFTFYGKQEIIRSSSRVVRSLVTVGKLRAVQRSEHNPHGFLIENWEIIENRDLNHYPR